jgi:hypothetical protein
VQYFAMRVAKELVLVHTFTLPSTKVR